MNGQRTRFPTGIGCLACLLAVPACCQVSLTTKARLDSLFAWLTSNPPNGSVNWSTRRQRSTTIDLYGIDTTISAATFNSYKSAWSDPAQCAIMENQYAILYYLRTTTLSALTDVKSMRLTGGMVVWYFYTMGVVVKTRDKCFGIDLNFREAESLVPLLDFAIVSHAHPDHYSDLFCGAMVKAGKPLYTTFWSGSTIVNKPAEYAFGEVQIRLAMTVQGALPVIASQICCGPSAGNYTLLHLGDCTDAQFPLPNRTVDLMICHIDCGLDIPTAIARVRPLQTMLAHEMELGHEVGQARWSYNYSYDHAEWIKLSPASSFILTWGEKLVRPPDTTGTHNQRKPFCHAARSARRVPVTLNGQLSRDRSAGPFPGHLSTHPTPRLVLLHSEPGEPR